MGQNMNNIRPAPHRLHDSGIECFRPQYILTSNDNIAGNGRIKV